MALWADVDLVSVTVLLLLFLLVLQVLGDLWWQDVSHLLWHGDDHEVGRVLEL